MMGVTNKGSEEVCSKDRVMQPAEQNERFVIFNTWLRRQQQNDELGHRITNEI